MKTPSAAGFVLGSLLVFVNPVCVQAAPAPALNLSLSNSQAQLTWQTTATDFAVETADTLSPGGTWVARTSGLTNVGTNFTFTTSIGAATSFYRLHKRYPTGDPITAPAGTWTWVPFPNSFCMEGTTTGIGVNLATNSSRVLIFLLGGGACWDETTCYILNTASHGPYGQSQFNNQAASLGQVWIFDRTRVSNPFKDYNYVFVPYCTGDLHAGSRTNQYGAHTTLQVGFQNLAAFLQRIVPTFRSAERVVLAGSSSGGFGAVFNWWQTQEAFGGVRVDLIDDSGPVMPPDVIAQGNGFLSPTPIANWNLAAALPSTCAVCPTNLASTYSFFAASYPSNRAALLSYNADQVMSSFYGITSSQFTAGLNELLLDAFDPQPNFKYFIVNGTAHTALTGSPSLTTGGVTIEEFVTKLVTDDPAWANAHP